MRITYGDHNFASQLPKGSKDAHPVHASCLYTWGCTGAYCRKNVIRLLHELDDGSVAVETITRS